MGQEMIRRFEQVRSPEAALPFPLSIETGFPYGKAPFISAAASGWARMALTLAAKAPSQITATIATGRRRP